MEEDANNVATLSQSALRALLGEAVKHEVTAISDSLGELLTQVFREECRDLAKQLSETCGESFEKRLAIWFAATGEGDGGGGGEEEELQQAAEERQCEEKPTLTDRGEVPACQQLLETTFLPLPPEQQQWQPCSQEQVAEEEEEEEEADKQQTPPTASSELPPSRPSAMPSLLTGDDRPATAKLIAAQQEAAAAAALLQDLGSQIAREATSGVPGPSLPGEIRESYRHADTPPDSAEPGLLQSWHDRISDIVDEAELESPTMKHRTFPAIDSPSLKKFASTTPWQRFKRLPARGKLHFVVDSNYFDYTICSAIILNSIMISWQCQYSIDAVQRNGQIDTPAVFAALEYMFCVIFTSELVLRLACHRLRFFYMPDWRWNIFDSIIIGMQFLDVSMELLLGGAKSLFGNFNFMRVLRVLRLLRIIRLVRVLRYLQDLRTMVASIAFSSRSLIWTVVLLCLLINVVGVYLTNLVADAAVNHPEILEEEAIRMYYGSLFATTFSLFQAMTGGVDWSDLAHPLVQEISPLLALVFSLYIVFSVLCMTNVITGIFVESALGTARKDKDADLRSQIQNLFFNTDSDKSGRISLEEFTAALDNPDVIESFKAMEVDPSEAKGIFALLDTDDSGDIDGTEFVTGFLRLHGEARAIDLATLMYFNKRLSAWFVQQMTGIEDSLGFIWQAVQGLQSESPVRRKSTTGFTGVVSEGPVRRKSTTCKRAPTSFAATWSDLVAEGDRRVAESNSRHRRRRYQNNPGDPRSVITLKHPKSFRRLASLAVEGANRMILRRGGTCFTT